MNSLLSIFSSIEDENVPLSSLMSDGPESLPPECEQGNIEYKLKLVNPTSARFEHLVTQMKWRLQEGCGVALYEIGVEDNGGLKGLTQHEIDASLSTLNRMANKIGATLTITRENIVVPKKRNHEKRKALEVLVRKLPDDKHSTEVRIIVLGSVDAGKSSLLGVLTQGELDNGKGRSRLNLFRHSHEIKSGRTSSISKEILGFDSVGVPLTYNGYQNSEEICKKSSKIAVFIDSAGYQKYLKTTVFSLTAMHPDYVLFVVNGLTGIESGNTKQYLHLALAIDIPIAIVINKIDLCTQQQLTKTLSEIETFFLLQSISSKKKTLLIENESHVINHFASNSSSLTYAVPIFKVSCVHGTGLNLLYKFIYLMDSSLNKVERDILIKQKTVFQIDEIFHIHNVGDVVSGFLQSGMIEEGSHLKIGPFLNGAFLDVVVSSLQRHKVFRRRVHPGESSTLALRLASKDPQLVAILNKSVRKGMVLLSDHDHSLQSVCFTFQAKIMSNSFSIDKRFHATAYIENVRQSVVVTDLDEPLPQEPITVTLKFIKQPEFIRPGYRLLLQQGSTKAIGHVTKVFPFKAGN